MAYEGLSGLSASNIPELGRRIASAGDEHVLIWAQRQAVERCVRKRTKVSGGSIIG